MAHLRITTSMPRAVWNDALDKLSDWFRVKNLTRQQSDSMYSRLRVYPPEALEYAVAALIEERRPTPGNWPTIQELANRCYEWLHRDPEREHAMTEYDRVDDADYPIRYLWEGFRILERRGEDEFRRYADRVRMPLADRERVANKLRTADTRVQVDAMVAGIGTAKNRAGAVRGSGSVGRHGPARRNSSCALSARESGI